MNEGILLASTILASTIELSPFSKGSKLQSFGRVHRS
jgi:hypothetical protein